MHKTLAAYFYDQPIGHCAFHWQPDGVPSISLRVEDSLVESARRGAAPSMELRTSLQRIGAVGVVPVLVRVNGRPPTYFLPLNHYSSIYQSPLHHWATASELSTHLHGSTPAMTVAYHWQKEVSAVFRPIVEAAEAIPAWSEEDFRCAINGLPSADHLWRTL